jgi:hypothetical protein
MSATTIVFGFGYLGMGLLFVALAVPLIRGRVRPNVWYGIRIRAAFASEEAWYRINRHGGKSLLVLGCTIAAIGILNVIFLPPNAGPPLVLGLAVLPGLLLVPFLVHVFRYPRS